MESVFLAGQNFSLIYNYKDNKKYRQSLNELTQKTFGFNFEAWYENGYWGDNYIPFSLLDGTKVVANVSVSLMEFNVKGKKKRYIQIATVMTDTNYRQKGLSKYLMDRVLEEYKDKVENIYLFANDSVLNFYPKFGFISGYEYQYYKNITSTSKKRDIEKLDMSLLENRQLLINKANNTVPIAGFSMINNTGLIMFYCTSFLSDNVYYLKEEDIVVVAEVEGEIMNVIDIFSEHEVNLEVVINSLCNENIKKVILGFTPKDKERYDINRISNEDTTLFFLKESKEFSEEKLMFPILSHT